jgi:hypothetical protein
MNRKRLVVFVAVAFVGSCVFAAFTAPAAVDEIGVSDFSDIWHSTKPFSDSLMSRVLALPWAFAGYATAKYEISQDNLSLEMFGLPAGSRPMFSEIVRERFGVKSKVVAGCVVTHWRLARWSAHNAAVVSEIRRRFGNDSLDIAAKEANDEYKRRYLEGTLRWQVIRRARGLPIHEPARSATR